MHIYHRLVTSHTNKKAGKQIVFSLVRFLFNKTPNSTTAMNLFY